MLKVFCHDTHSSKGQQNIACREANVILSVVLDFSGLYDSRVLTMIFEGFYGGIQLRNISPFQGLPQIRRNDRSKSQRDVRIIEK